jgi:hypothetical protein
MVPLPNAIFYTTHAFDISQQIKDVQSTRGFFGDAAGGGTATEDPLWGGTRAVRSNVPTNPPGASESKRQALDGAEGEDEAEGEDGSERVGFEGALLFHNSDILVTGNICSFISSQTEYA